MRTIQIVNNSPAVLDIESLVSFEVSSPALALGGPNILVPGETLKMQTERDVTFTLTDQKLIIEVA